MCFGFSKLQPSKEAEKVEVPTVLRDLVQDKRDQKGSWAPGNYMNTCFSCKKPFIGDKLARMCAPCAYGDEDNTGV